MAKRILLTNDDGIGADGLSALEKALSDLGDIAVVAPLFEQSAKSHAITLSTPLRMKDAGSTDGCRRFSLDGTPSDCVYMGVNKVLAGQLPDLVCSGINHGPNIGSDVIYSGTVAAAVEGALMGIPAVAFSLTDGDDFDACIPAVRAICQFLLDDRIDWKGCALNVNFPEGADERFALTKLGTRTYGGQVVERIDPRGRPYLWVGGSRATYDLVPGTDCEAIYGQKITSLTPLCVDLTHENALERLRKTLGTPSSGNANLRELQAKP